MQTPLKAHTIHFGLINTTTNREILADTALDGDRSPLQGAKAERGYLLVPNHKRF